MKYASAAATLIFSAAAFAQGGATGSIRSGDAPVTLPREGRFTGDEARAISDKFADCVVRRRHQPVIKALQKERDTPEQFEALHRLLDAECWGGNGLESQSSGYDIEMTTNPLNFRGALYKAVVKRDYSRRPKPFGDEPIVGAGSNANMLRFADCVVRRDQATSLQLLVAIAGTSKEQDALDALKPQLSQCLVQGITLTFTKGQLVVYLAEAYYREAQAATDKEAAE